MTRQQVVYTILAAAGLIMYFYVSGAISVYATVALLTILSASVRFLMQYARPDKPRRRFGRN